MANTALNRTGVFLGTNKSGGNLNYGDVVILDNTNNNGFTTTTSGALSTRGIGVIIEPNGIANNATGTVASSGWVPKINLNTSATRGQLLKTHTVAGQATPHDSPQVEGDFGFVLDITSASAPTAWLFGSCVPPGAGATGTVTHTAGNLTANELVVGNASADLKVVAATDGQVPIGKSSDGSVTLATLTQGTGITITNAAASVTIKSAPGAVVQVVNTETGAVSTGTTTIPMDDTIPQNTEGTEFMTLAITPTSATNKLRIHVVYNCAHSAGPTWLIAALFQDTTANALAAVTQFDSPSGGGGCGFGNSFTHYMTSGTTSSTTFKVRLGGSAVGTVTFNGAASARFMGGVYASSITIEEIAA